MRNRKMIYVLVAASIALATLIGAIAYTSKPAKTATQTAADTTASTPVIAGIRQPDPACTPARTTGPGRQQLDATVRYDTNGTLFVGYINGAQQETTLYDALMSQIRGQRVEYVWLCPLHN